MMVLGIIVPLAVVTLAALVWMWPTGADVPGTPSGRLDKVTGTVVRVDPKPCGAPAVPGKCGEATVELTSGPMAGRTIRSEVPSGAGNRTFAAGDDVVLVGLPGAAGGDTYQLSDHDRSNALWMMAAAFALAVVAFGRWRGVTALIGLAVTFALLLLFLIPAIVEGRPPLPAAIVCAAAIMLAVLYLTHGFTVTTSIAVMGTLGSLVLTGLLAMVAIDLARLTGITDDSSLFLDINYSINTEGLLLASVIIGALGVLDDVTVTQSVTVRELARANPSYSFARLYRAATRVGRAHIASVINTIILAYAGAALPLLLLFELGRQSTGAVLTSPAIAQEIARSTAGTIGLIAAVPLTTALAALAAVRGARRPEPDDDEPATPPPAR